MILSPLVLRWRLAPGILLIPSGETDLTIDFGTGNTATVALGAAGLRDALLALAEGADEASLLALARGNAAAPLYFYLARLISRGALEASADYDKVSLMRLVPRSKLFELPVAGVLPDWATLDRFACIRRTERGATLQHPDSVCDLVVEDAGAFSLIARLMGGSLCTHSLTVPLDRALTALLVALGFAVDANVEDAPARQTWEFHDRLFQRATRSYDDLIVRGGTYRFASKWPAPPAIRPAYAGTSISLSHQPAPSSPSSGHALHEVMESRRSLRAVSEQPVDLEVIGQLLHRVARIKAVLPETTKIAQETMLRPYPSAGAIHELEFYLAVRSCAGLTPGFYHYRGQQHALTRIAGAEAPAAAMLADCAKAWGQPDRPPQVLVVIASRLPRIAWKYAGIAYRLSLMNAGVAIQSLHLAATDLGLAGSAAGSGHPDHFAQATGVCSWEETSIAEFGFGRME